MIAHRTAGDIALFAGVMQSAGLDAGNVATVIEFESARTWSPSVHNPGSAAVGLIQFMPDTAKALGTSSAALEQMSFAEQLPWVVKHFQRAGVARLTRMVDYYAAVFWPAAIGTADDFVIAKAGSTVYEANKGLDRDGNGEITTADLTVAMAQTRVTAKGTIDVIPSHSTGLSPRGAGLALGALILTALGVAGALIIRKVRGG
jgi:hypothetical protein